MTRKHYVALAELVRKADYLDETTRAALVADLVTFCADYNPRFSPSRFRDACEPEDALDEIIDRAEREGYERGVAAGSWLLDEAGYGRGVQDEAVRSARALLGS